MTKPYNFLVFIGRFQPFHLGHWFVINEALNQADTVIVLIGSANRPRALKNPFNYEERAEMILRAFGDEYDGRILCVPLEDYAYNDNKWLACVQSTIFHITGGTGRVGVIGHHKDDSSYYLSLFPLLGGVNLPNYDNLSATPIRHTYFEQGVIDNNLPNNVQAFLAEFQHTSAFSELQQEHHHVSAYRQAWAAAPYPPTFVTADALVVQAGHILLIERGGEYGHGLYALAGGFLDGGETLLDCAVRELYEETGLVIDKAALKSSRTFDAPDRSVRGRTVTTVFYFELTGDSLPTVQGSDDARRAFWLPLGELDSQMMFEDHYDVIVAMLGV